MPLYQFRQQQFIPATLGDAWDFISSPGNLKEITPPYMGFDILTGDLPKKMYAGMIIHYRVKPLFGIPVSWVTEITHVRDREYFVDEQRHGPYAFWHHQHLLEETEGGVMMTDIVSYRPPLGFLGALANFLVIRKKLNEIFLYREKALLHQFPKP